MYDSKFSEHIQEILVKLSRKDKALHEQVLNKISEIVNSLDVEHYKNLQYNMKDSKRVHVGHFVLIFQFSEKNNLILFDDFAHHDDVYKR